MDDRNIIFMILDTVRADMLKPYGGNVEAGTIERLSKDGVLYEMAISPGTWTLPSHLSLFLGRRARRIPGLRRSGMRFSDIMADPLLKKSRYNRGEITTAQVMEYFGYRSALFSNNPFISEETGLANGFSYVNNPFVEEKIKSNRLSVKAVLSLIQNDYTRKGLVELAYSISSVIPDGRLDGMYLSLRKRLNRHFSDEYGYYDLDKGAGATNTQLDRYLGHNMSGRNFIFINYMEGHEGYPTNLVTDRYVEQDKWLHMIGEASTDDLECTRRAYEKRIEYVDAKAGQAIEIMKRHGLLDNATIIISSDHGQAFMEHGEMFHNVHPYNEVVRVPLVMANFRHGRQVRERKRIGRPFSLTRLNNLITGKKAEITDTPVVADHLGITEVWDTHLLGLFRKRSRNADRMYRKKAEHDVHSTALFHKGYKLMHYYGRRKDELYHLKSDVGESDNLIDKERSVAHEILAYNEALC